MIKNPISSELFKLVYLKHRGQREDICEELGIGRAYFFQLKKKYNLNKIASFKKETKVGKEVKKGIEATKISDKNYEMVDKIIESSKITVEVLDEVELRLINMARKDNYYAITYILNNHGWKRGYEGLRSFHKGDDKEDKTVKVVEVLDYGSED